LVEPLAPFTTKIVREGLAELVVPASATEGAAAGLPAFYNPLSKPSRDLAVIVTAVYFGGRGAVVAEPLTGTGARVIRLLLESGAFTEGLAGDISEWAVKLAEVNAARNGLSNLLKIERIDANLLLARIATMGRADYVDIDPFGSPIRFLENGFRATRRGGLLGVSATDLAALTGKSRRTAYWRYSLSLVRTNFYKETAIRALAGVAATTASRLSLSAEPIASLIYRHFVRVFFRVDRGRRRAYSSRSQVKYLSHCMSCLNTCVLGEVSEWRGKCELCGEENVPLGPLWVGRLLDREILSRALSSRFREDQTYSEAFKMLARLSLELDDIPWSFQLSEISSRAHTSTPRTVKVVERLREIGFRASTTHYDPTAVKTDAPPTVLFEVVKDLAGNRV